mmetsp:Transcript_33595/g.54440  ORF Transcript_33595/g.54440 Transcript_33595/m.54440 type:complete len:758 (-) Transcript_33595:811-3084(-)
MSSVLTSSVQFGKISHLADNHVMNDRLMNGYNLKGFSAAKNAAVSDSGQILPFDAHRGHPLPMGTHVERRSVDNQDSIYVNFAIPSTTAKSIALCLFLPDAPSDPPFATITLDVLINKTGHVWHVAFSQAYQSASPPGSIDLRKLNYGYRVNGAPGVIADPYAKLLNTGSSWGERLDKEYFRKDKGAVRRCTVSADGDGPPFDWDGDIPPRIPEEDLIIYEVHVRGFTIHPSSKVGDRRGTFLGIVDKIPHLRELGINCLELLPVYEWNETEYELSNPVTKKKLCQYWGYSTENFFAPMARFASKGGNAVLEFKTMVRELHRNGIEVVLDVVYNHTAEQGKNGRTLSFRALDELIWYIHGPPPKNDFYNFSGCGNTLSCNHPIVRDFLLESLRYWVTEMHVDGFRFDLASILCRDVDGTPLPKPPVIESISLDPVLAHCKLIAEPWDAAGLYHVGTFPHWGRWAEWNGKFRDIARRFVRGIPGQAGAFATRLCGSQDLYGTGRRPHHSINFVTCHDGFTLYDVVSYNSKHNFENGENNNDGSNDNESWNCGVEGDTDRSDVNALRLRMMKNFHLCLMLSHGTPMMNSGDEYGHTKMGNNNTWCQDSELNWFLWDRLESNRGLFRFFCMVNKFRLQHKVLRRTNFFSAKDIEWHGYKPGSPDWGGESRFVAFVMKDHDTGGGGDVYAAFNCNSQQAAVVLPAPPKDKVWLRLVNTSKPSPDDFVSETKANALTSSNFNMPPYSSIMLLAVPRDSVGSS